jgi:hypothetical protein
MDAPFMQKKPAAHSATVPLLQNEPAEAPRQAVGMGAVRPTMPLGQFCPAPHWVGVLMALLGQYDPLGQSFPMVIPLVSQYVPSLQDVQLLKPSNEANVPIEHVVHTVIPAALAYEPGAHFVGDAAV